MKIILASTSPYRKELLAKLGVTFETDSPICNEDEFKSAGLDHVDLAKKLAYEKAKSVFDKNPDAIVIGSDQVCSFEGKILSKTGSLEKSYELLKRLSGKEHRLITAYCIVTKEKTVQDVNITNLRMRELSDKQIKKYLTNDNPVDCAGSYKLESKGISLFSSINTTDYTGIIGLPLISLGSELEKIGVNLISS